MNGYAIQIFKPIQMSYYLAKFGSGKIWIWPNSAMNIELDNFCWTLAQNCWDKNGQMTTSWQFLHLKTPNPLITYCSLHA